MPTNYASAAFDTNLIVYLVTSDHTKRRQAQDVMSAGGHLSVQVLNEFVAVARRKLAMDWDTIQSVLDGLVRNFEVHPVTLKIHTFGVAIAKRHGLRIYDALIVSAAISAGCRILYSEDMHHGLVIDGLTITNPFL